MQIIKAGYEAFPIAFSDEMISKIEKVARVCYKSEDKICDGSAKRMVKALVNNKHYAMLEHGSLIVSADTIGYCQMVDALNTIRSAEGEAPYIRYTPKSYSGRYLISGNFRAWLEYLELCEKYDLVINKGLGAILTQDKYSPVFDITVRYVSCGGKYEEVEPVHLTPKEQLIHLDFTVKFIVDRGVSHEIVRHRVASFAQESTRFCNYGNNGGEITVIEPFYLMVDGVRVSNENWSERYGAWVRACEEAERSYLRMVADGSTPQEARAVLPTSLKTEVVMTANLREWRHFFSLRACGSTGKPHPQMLEVAVPLLKELKEIIPVVFDDLEPMEV